MVMFTSKGTTKSSLSEEVKRRKIGRSWKESKKEVFACAEEKKRVTRHHFDPLRLQLGVPALHSCLGPSTSFKSSAAESTPGTNLY